MLISNSRLRLQNRSNPNTNEYQFCTENSVITAALSHILSNSTDENKLSIVSPPKNVKFVVPLTRSGMASNDSTYGVVDSTTRTITHVKDIFPLNLTSQSQIIANENDILHNRADSPVTTSILVDTNQQHETIINDSEEIPLLPIENSNEQDQ